MKNLPKLQSKTYKLKLRSLFLFLFIFYVLSFILTPFTQASFSVPVEAQVGQYYLNISGYISPYASIELTIDGVFTRATVADGQGKFSITGVLIKAGFSKFCLDAIDFKRLGESYTCFNVPPAKSDVNMDNLFLPPTLGLSKTEIAAGGEVLAFGYTMPNAQVTIYLSNGQKLTTTADGTGYYIFHIKGLSAGQYNLYSRANYQGRESLAPTKTVKLRALSFWEQLTAFIQGIISKIAKALTSWALGPLWLGLPILILIIILILKLWPEKFTFIYQSHLLIFATRAFRRPRRPLHHQWWIGY